MQDCNIFIANALEILQSCAKSSIYFNTLDELRYSFVIQMRRVITWWRHQMETFSALLAICAGSSPVPGEFPAQRPVTQSFGVFFDLCLNKRWVNNRDAGDLRRYRAHYDVNVIQMRRVITSHSLSECNYLSRPQSQLISVSNRGPSCHVPR